MNRFIRVKNAEKATKNRICWERKDIIKRDIERNKCLDMLIEALVEALNENYLIYRSSLKRGDDSG